MNVTIEPNFLYVNCTDHQAKQLDAVWVKSKSAYRLPNTLGALRELHRLGYDVAEYGKKKAALKDKFIEMKKVSFTATPERLKMLRPYQKTDIQFLQQLPHAAIFNEQRTGKTPTTLKLIEWEEHEKIIVICPASLVLNWEKEVKTWTNYDVFSVKGTKTKRLKTYQEWELKKGFLVLSKDTAKADSDLLNFKDYALIVDEAHFLRNYQSQQSKAIYKLGKHATKRLALTGTPAVNKGDDMYGILHFLYPERFSSYWQFVDRYFKTWDSPWGVREVNGYKRKEELQEILDLISVQRKRSEVMQWIPPKQYQKIEVEMNAKQRKAYEDMLFTFQVEEEGEISVDAPSVLAQLTRLRQICLSPDLLNIKAPSTKEHFILEWLEDNPNEQVNIFSNFSSYLKKLYDKLRTKNDLGIGLIIGETDKVIRQAVVEQFQKGNIKIILANIQAAGVGLTLDAASTVIFLDRAYEPVSNIQAEDRIIPTTETSNQSCTVIDVVCKNSIDEKIHDILSKKQSVIEVVNNYRNIGEMLRNEKIRSDS
jgi:SNF2 family DNA or RNA helicase